MSNFKIYAETEHLLFRRVGDFREGKRDRYRYVISVLTREAKMKIEQIAPGTFAGSAYTISFSRYKRAVSKFQWLLLML
jgi:hypothetical protein